MADTDKADSIEVTIKKKPPVKDKKGGGYLAKTEDTESSDSSVKNDDSQSASHQGKTIQPDISQKSDETESKPGKDKSTDDTADKESEVADQEADEEVAAKPVKPSQLNTPVKSDPVPGDGDSDEEAAAVEEGEQTVDIDPEKTVAAHATMQREALLDERDYKISKKQLKKAPFRSRTHLHKTWLFIVLVIIVSFGLAYAYLTVIEGLNFEQITTRLGL